MVVAPTGLPTVLQAGCPSYYLIDRFKALKTRSSANADKPVRRV